SGPQTEVQHPAHVPAHAGIDLLLQPGGQPVRALRPDPVGDRLAERRADAGVLRYQGLRLVHRRAPGRDPLLLPGERPRDRPAARGYARSPAVVATHGTPPFGGHRRPARSPDEAAVSEHGQISAICAFSLKTRPGSLLPVSTTDTLPGMSTPDFDRCS